MLEAVAQVDCLGKQEDFLDHHVAEALCHEYDNVLELEKAEEQEAEAKRLMTESTNDSLPSSFDPSFFENLLPEVMSQLDFPGETFEEVPSNL